MKTKIRRCLLLALLLFSFPVFAQTIYGMSPFYIGRGTGVNAFTTIENRLPELRDLGVDIIWLQPLFISAQPGQGYDVTDFYGINPELGSAAQLKSLVRQAHALGLKVIFDLPLNHTALAHPMVVDILKNKKASPFFDYYQHRITGDSFYNRFLNVRTENKIDFYHYFWADLVNLNYDNTLVQHMAVDIVQYWMREFEIDGYRFDASWAPASRWPPFYETIRMAMEQIHPQAFILAEDHTANPLLAGVVDYAYDWSTSDPEWLSKWSFQTGEAHAETVFNEENPTTAAKLFTESLIGNLERGTVLPVRYIENNDTGSFLQHHSLEQTKFASAVQFILPGVPLLFYGQAEGMNYAQWELPTFPQNKRLADLAPELWRHYRQLMAQRKAIGKIQGLSRLKRAGSRVEFNLVPSGHKVVIDFKKQQVNVTLP